MKYLLFLFLTFPLLGASSFKNEQLNPRIKEPRMPGARTPIENVNTAPNPTPDEELTLPDKFRTTTINTKKSDFEAKPGDQKKPQKKKSRRKL